MDLAQIPERLQNKVEQRGKCWVWTGCVNWNGYGLLWNGKKTQTAHRFFYELFVGKISSKMTIDHLCRNRVCVNPKHLEIVSARENVLRGVGISAQNAKKTHCIRGHKFTNENTYIYPDGKKRRCRTCYNSYAR